MRKAKEKNKPLLSLAAAGLAALLLFGMATAVLAQGTQGKFVADEWSGIAEADIAEGDSTKDQAENQASTTPTPTPVSTQDESTALSDATPESAESSELTENKETDSDSNAEIPAEVSAFSNDLAVEEVSLYDASGTSAQDAVTSWTELKSAVASAANGATIYLSGEITIPLDEVLSVSKNLRLVGTGSAQYTNTVGVGSETVAQGYTYTQNASLRMGDASGVQTDHDNVMIYISGGTVQGDHLNCYGNSYSGISAMKNESLDQTATLELTAPVTSHENGHSGLYLKGGTKATVSGGSFTENGAEHAEIYAGSGTDTTLKDGVEVKTSADKTLQNSGLRIAVMLDGVDVFRTDSTLQIPAGDSIHLKQDADVVTWNGGTREQLGVTCENPWLGRTIIQSDTAVLDWENSRESNNAQTAEQHPENGIDTNVYYTAIEDAYFGMKNSDAHDVWLSYKSNYRYYYNHDAAAGTALTVDGIDSGELLGTVRKFYGITADVTAPTDVDDTAPYYICSANAGHSAAVQTHCFADWLLDAKTYADGVTTLQGGAALQDITINDDGGSILGSYGNHKTVTAEPAVLSYYAGWQAAMTYDLDGGTLNGEQNGFSETKHNGQGYTVQAEPQKEGYRFLGWKATQSWNGETALTDGLLAAGTSYANDYDTTFTAQWKRINFTLKAIAVNGTPDIGQAVSDNITSESDGTTQTKTESEVPLGESRAVTYAPLASGNYLLSGIYLDEDAEKMQNNLAKKYPQNIEFADIDADHTVKAVYVPVDAPTKTVTDEAGNDLNGGTVRAGDTLVYTVTCCNPADVAKTVTITDAIPEGTELVENSITENGAENNGKIVWTLEIPTQSEARVSFTVRVQSVVMGNSVSNRASVQYREDKITLPTDEVTTNVEPGKITVTKKLPASDLLAAHGAPVFTFTLTDAKGRVQRQSVQLSLDAEPDENGDVCASVTFTGLSGGVYTVIESQTVCHALVQFEDAENGTAKADCAVLELTGCRASASVTARNVRQSWAEDRDCALIVNEITPKQDNS